MDGRWEGDLVQDTQRFNTLKAELDAFDMVSRYAVQNDMVLPRTSNKFLYTSHLDFETSTLNIFDKVTVRDSGFVKADPSVEYLFLCPEIAVMSKHEQLVAEISFEVRSADSLSPLPLLVMRCGEFYQALPLDIFSNHSFKTGHWEQFHSKCAIPLQKETDPTSLKIYLWNRDKGLYYLDNLVVDIME